MKLTIDTINKTIQINESIQIQELIQQLMNLNIGNDYQIIPNYQQYNPWYYPLNGYVITDSNGNSIFNTPSRTV